MEGGKGSLLVLLVGLFLVFFFLKRWRERQEWLLFALMHQELAGARGVTLGWMDTVW